MLAAQRLPQAGRAGVRSLELRKPGGISTLCPTRTDLAKSFHVATAARTTRGCGLLWLWHTFDTDGEVRKPFQHSVDRLV